MPSLITKHLSPLEIWCARFREHCRRRLAVSKNADRRRRFSLGIGSRCQNALLNFGLNGIPDFVKLIQHLLKVFQGNLSPCSATSVK